ncbi:M56 family metallopeptidase [Gimesia algae]|uniref:Regulatory protein BlaR1 n=1 Tax=Gimesia algae TaxID=2527971 RepID=A0A517VAA2_9PLAN|nr:M56 family metallopeptidase [Gimesia algae]QDT89937.1 Regulatory protein BlaR1 [Gimesia algae]
MRNALLSLPGLENGFALDLAVKSTLLAALAAGLVLLLSRSSAALRHRVWTLFFLTLLILPLVTFFAPAWNWRVIPRAWQAETITAPVSPTPPVVTSAPAFSENRLTPPIIATDVTRTADQNELAIQSQPIPPVINTKTNQAVKAASVPIHTSNQPAAFDWSMHTLTLIWLSGILLTLLPLVTGLLGNWRLRKQSRRLNDADWQQTMTALSDRLGLQRPVTLLSGGPHQMPITFGLWNPCVVLPDDATNWDEERRQVVLLHELAHVKRLDVPLQMIARLGCALFWFHPLVWWSAHQMRLEREHACDDCVLLAGQEPSVYASQLLEIAHQLSNQSRFTTAALCMARKSQLEGRLLAVLDTQRSRAQVGLLRTLSCLLLALLLVTTLGIVHPTLQVETLLTAAEKEPAPTTPTSESEQYKLMRITGTVLSPDGKPQSGAHIDLFSDQRGTNWHRSIPGVDDFESYQTKTDQVGWFQIVLPHDISRPRKYMQIIASVAGGLLAKKTVDPHLLHHHCDLKLSSAKKIRVQLIDTVGNPVVGIEPYLSGMMLGKDNYINIRHPKPDSLVSAWPRFSKSDNEGYIETMLPASTTLFGLLIDDKQVGAHAINVNVSDKPVSVALKPAQFLSGKVIDEKTDQPIAGAEVMILEKPYRIVRTNADGSFRIARGTALNTLFPSGETIINVYPPSESAYLFHALEWKWPNNRLSDADLTIKMKTGILLTGRVTETETGKPVPKVTLFFESQEYNNPLFDSTSECRFFGADMKYTTDAAGRFQMPVWPGPGRLIVTAPTLDYVHQEDSMGDKYYGKPGLQREYYDAVTRLNFKPNEHPKPLEIELERGFTLRQMIVRPDGQPASGKVFARSYLPFKNDIDASLPEMLLQDGQLELPGFHPQKSMPLFFLDLEHHCGKIVTEFYPEDAPIQLEKCGTATFQFEDNNGKPLVGHEPLLIIIVTPGVTNTAMIEPEQPLWFEHMFWQNILRPDRISKTDAEGRVTVNDLIPGATYQLQLIKKGRWASGYEFTVRPGETTDVGKVVLELQ